MREELNRLLAQRLRRRRRLLGITQSELGDACGLRFQQIQKYETGINRISAATLWLLAQALGVDPGYFYDGIEEVATDRPERRSAANDSSAIAPDA